MPKASPFLFLIDLLRMRCFPEIFRNLVSSIKREMVLVRLERPADAVPARADVEPEETTVLFDHL